ncbi:MAG: hypothetical protein KAT25_10085 [Sulfuriflexus sp.]|nr:hypothetical protein [Sulfuriflexus sp.]
MQDYLADNWTAVLEHNGLKSFDDWWQREAEWFEEPNHRRGGWSGVSRVELKDKDGATRTIFLKRQENHVAKTLAHPLKGIPTFVREMQNILLLRDAQVAALTPVYFAERTIDGAQRAILATEELDGFSPLDTVDHASLTFTQRNKLIKSTAELIQRFHAQRLQHNCLYAKHVFIKQAGDDFESRLIDLEKTKPRFLKNTGMNRDLDSFNRHAYGWSRTDRLRFLHYYLSAAGLEHKLTEIWNMLAKRQVQRSERR